jgi:hypothetical protein
MNVLLAAGLAASALRPRPVVVLPAARSGVELLPGAVPEEAAREFALRYVLHFDNFTPSTLDATQQVLQRMIAARAWSGGHAGAREAAPGRPGGRMSSQVIPLSTQVAGMTVTVNAVRRIFISDRLSREAKVRYEVTLERQPATDPNPFGLGVVTQVIHEEPTLVEKEKMMSAKSMFLILVCWPARPRTRPSACIRRAATANPFPSTRSPRRRRRPEPAGDVLGQVDETDDRHALRFRLPACTARQTRAIRTTVPPEILGKTLGFGPADRIPRAGRARGDLGPPHPRH